MNVRPLLSKQERRDRPRVRAVSIAIGRTTKEEVVHLRLLHQIEGDHDRPATRGDCLPGGMNEERPCPFVGCRYHLAVDVHERTGSLQYNFPGTELEQMAETCALDVADQGGATLDDVGELVNVTRERIRQIQDVAFRKVLASGAIGRRA